MAEFHWIGSTGNSLEKFNWNNINNWAVKGSNGKIMFAKNFGTGRLPHGGDVVKIGTDLHCFSPLLYGGYEGGTGHVTQTASGSTGWWGRNSGAYTAAGYAAGVTGGGVTLMVATDVAAASQSSSMSSAIAIGAMTTSNAGRANDIWGAGVVNAAANSNRNFEDVFFSMLATVNPHSAGIGSSGQAVTSSESSKYPFPYLGGGVTGDTYRYLKAVWAVSYSGLTGGVVSIQDRNENGWVGGGWTGAESALTSEVRSGLRLRVGNMGTQAAVEISPGVNATPKNRIFNTVLDIVADKSVGAAINTDVKLSSRGNPLHSYVIKNGSIRTVKSEGDAAISLQGCTAGHVLTDYHNYTHCDRKTVVGGMFVDNTNDDPRYHPWVTYFAGSVTAGAVTAVYGNTSIANAIRVGYNGKLLFNTPPSTYSEANVAAGMSGVNWSSINPLIGLGEFGGTGGPIIDTAGASAVYFTDVPSIEIMSNVDPVTTTTTNTAATRWNLEMLGNLKVGSISMIGGNVYYSRNAKTDATVYVGELRLSDGAVLDFTANPNMDNFFFGGVITGANNSIQFAGGIKALDETCTIKPSMGGQFLNNKIVSNNGIFGLDQRATSFNPNNETPFYATDADVKIGSGVNVITLPTFKE